MTVGTKELKDFIRTTHCYGHYKYSRFLRFISSMHKDHFMNTKFYEFNMKATKSTTIPRYTDKNIEVSDVNGDDVEIDDVDDDDEHGLDTTTTETSKDDRRDEVGEVRKMSSKDTNRLRLWRIVVTSVLLLTAFAVTFTTYTLLEQQEDENFKTAFEQFARTVGDAAMDQQRRLRESYVGFANHISDAALQVNATWPMFRIPNFELHAGQVRLQSGTEVVGCSYLVDAKDANEYIEFVTTNYEASIKEAHLTSYGTLDRLSPIGYTPNFTVFTPDGIIPDIVDRPLRYATWQISPPVPSYFTINWDAFTGLPDFVELSAAVLSLKNQSVASPVRPYTDAGILTPEEHAAMHSTRSKSDISFPHSFIMTPVYTTPNDPNSKIVAYVTGGIAWDHALRNLLPNNVEGIIVELQNTCNQTNLYELVGYDAFFLGENATRESKYDGMEVVRDLSFGTHPNFTTTPGHCQYSIHVYPSTKFYTNYKTKTPTIYAIVVAFTFALVAIVFLIYDILVQKRNEKMLLTAARSNAIVSSMFPDAIRDRLLEQNNISSKQGHLKSYLMHGEEGGSGSSSKPLADLFLETTVMFADISGFTAWSSVRDPSQVFTLLETLYKAFDEIAKRRRIFKVETVGDCYVAVAGLPEPKKDHAVMMARFAREIMSKMNTITKVLELTLGPGTGDLKLRIGLHSGPVTGGVLRGERSRFQLFGDTMNTTARIENSGARGCIHLSSETAELLRQAGKQAWIMKRSDLITAKGKGSMQTYWLSNIHDHRDDHTSSAESDRNSHSNGQDNVVDIDELIVVSDRNGKLVTISQQTSRLINWNVEQLLGILRQIVARRSVSESQSQPIKYDIDDIADCKKMSPLDEVQEIITLPEFDVSADHQGADAVDVVIPPVVVEQLKAYITWVSSMYKNNPFHNFDHASHVVMSVIKLMSRIVAPTDHHMNDNAATLHDHTYGITSDPLTQFACVFSALIHDVDHTGVPNTTLVSEHVSIAAKYNNRSVAEQNSLDLAWEELMNETKYKELHATLFTNKAELIRFRKLVVNGVMATDIADKDLKTLRNNRWDKAFKLDQNHVTSSKEEERDAVNRKATIVIEHLIQASDVSHTMQHWHVFRKWNQALFEEMYEAYRAGRADKNPADFWYQGEIGFFDFYIIPLAKKLKDCGVFGVSSDEYLNYAMKNREEWEVRGHEVVMEMVEAVENNRRVVIEPPTISLDTIGDKNYVEC